MSKTEDKRTKRPTARHRDVIVGAMTERLSVITGNDEHVARLHELIEELGRSLRRKPEEGEA